MTTLSEKSKQNTDAMLAEARAVKKATKAYGRYRPSSPTTVSPTDIQAISREMVLSYLGGGR